MQLFDSRDQRVVFEDDVIADGVRDYVWHNRYWFCRPSGYSLGVIRTDPLRLDSCYAVGALAPGLNEHGEAFRRVATRQLHPRARK